MGSWFLIAAIASARSIQPAGIGASSGRAQLFRRLNAAAPHRPAHLVCLSSPSSTRARTCLASPLCLERDVVAAQRRLVASNPVDSPLETSSGKTEILARGSDLRYADEQERASCRPTSELVGVYLSTASLSRSAICKMKVSGASQPCPRPSTGWRAANQRTRTDTPPPIPAQLTSFSLLFALLVVASLMVLEQAEAYHKKHSQGHVKIKVWRGPSHGYKKHKHAPFGYHFSIEEKGH